MIQQLKLISWCSNKLFSTICKISL